MGKILVTGSSGFIGKSLTRKLSELGYEVIGLSSANGDICDKNTLLNYREEGIDYLFHLAGKCYVPASWSDTQSFYDTNVIGTLNVLEFCKSLNIGITYLSAYVYGIPEKLPITETDKINPNNPYAHSKFLAEQICEFYSREFNVKTVVFRAFNVYGRNQRDTFLIPKIIHQARNEKSIEVMDLYPKRDYIYIDDLIDAMVLSINKKSNFSVYNIGSGTSISVLEVIQIIQTALGTKKAVNSTDKARKNELSDVVADITKAKTELGWFPKIDFVEGINRLINL